MKRQCGQSYLQKNFGGRAFGECFFAFSCVGSQYRESRNDAKAVSIIALGCFHPVVKVQSASLHFFLGSDEEKEDSDEEEEDVGRLHLYLVLHG